MSKIPSAITEPVENYEWPDRLEAVTAAPDSHIVLHEDEEMRVLLVCVPPKTKEPIHTHKWPSVMIVEDGGKNCLETFTLEGDGRLESVSKIEVPIPEKLPFAFRLPPEVPHSFENMEDRPFRAVRVEFKRGDF